MNSLKLKHNKLPTTSIHSSIAAYSLSKQLSELFVNLNQPPVILCIGTDRVIGDALGPLVGHMLTKTYNVPSYVYGTLNTPVNAKNVLDTYNFIKAKHAGSKILAIDSAQDPHGTVGDIIANIGGITPASAKNNSSASNCSEKLKVKSEKLLHAYSEKSETAQQASNASNFSLHNPNSTLSVQHSFPSMGDFYCVGVVCENNFFSASLLVTTKLGIVYRMAEIIASAISDALDNTNK